MTEEKGVPLWQALAMWAFKSITVELGEEHWDRFVSAAAGSNVPSEFLSASRSRGDNFAAMAEGIFKTAFRNEDERAYAVSYANAMASVKSWASAEAQAKEAQEKQELVRERMRQATELMSSYAQQLRCTEESVPDMLVRYGYRTEREVSVLREIPNVMREIETMQQAIQQQIKLVEQLKGLAQSSCGSVVQLEKFGRPPSIKNFKSWLRWRLKRAFGKQATVRDLEHVRDWVELFFSEKQNRSNVILLARG